MGSGGSLAEGDAPRSGGAGIAATGGASFVGVPRSSGGASSSTGGRPGPSGATTGGVASSAGAKSAGGTRSNVATGGAAGRGGSANAAHGGAATGGDSASAGSNDVGTPLDGSCCPDGDCLCHAPPPSELTANDGPYETATLKLGTGTLHYPTDAEPPFAGIAICPGFLNTGPEMAPWGPFYASWGIAVVVTNTTGADLPTVRGDKLVAAIEELKTQNEGSGPLVGKLAGRYGTSGYSMGGGGTTFASAKDATFRTSVGLAAWGPEGRNVKVPTLFLCSESDSVAGCGFSQTAYDEMGSTPKMLVKIPSASHFAWFDPNDAGRGMSGKYALAFQKVFLEGDERWRPLLLATPTQGSVVTNIE